MTRCANPRCRKNGPPRRVSTTRRLCGPCIDRTRVNVAELPALYAALVHRLTPSGRSPTAGAEPVSGSRDPNLVINDAAAEARTQLRHDLAYWATLTAATRQMRPPADAWPHTTAAFCLRHLDWLAAHPDAGAFADVMAEDHRHAHAIAYPTGRRAVPVELCTELVGGAPCPGIYQAWVADTDDTLPAVISCTDCGAEYPPHRWRELRRRLRQRLPA